MDFSTLATRTGKTEPLTPAAEAEPFGIPYARHISPDVVECPVCWKHIKLTSKKDGESFTNTTYAEHYEKEHAGSSVATPAARPEPIAPPQHVSGKRPNGVKVIFTHEWIRLDLGNNRGLSTSYGGTKATGSIPPAVWKAWCEAVDGKGKHAAAGTKRGDWIVSFADDMDGLWPEWKKGPDTSRLVVGYRGSLFLGPRKGSKGYEIIALPARKGGSYTIKFDGDTHRTLVAADMLA